MPKHECETFDYPLAVGLVNYTVTKKLSAKGGGTWQIAVQEAIDEARQEAEDAGNAALKNDTCDPPCECFVYVDVSLDTIVPVWVKQGKVITIPITGVWKAGILCVRRAKKSEEKSGKKSEEKPKDKSGKKSDRKSANESNEQSDPKSDGKSKGKSGSRRKKSAE